MLLREKLKPVDIGELSCDPALIMRGFIAVKIRDLFPATTLPCDFYFPEINQATEELLAGKLLGKEQVYTEETHSYLSAEIDRLYIRPEDEADFLRYFNTEMQQLLKSGDVPTEKKTELLYDNAETIVGKVFRERPNRSNILLGKRLVNDLAIHLTSEHVTVKALLSLFSKDYYTYNHCVQVAMLGMSFCTFLGWNAKEITDFGLGALFHDVGKNNISEEILNKPGRLDREEFEIIKSHALIGYRELQQVTMLHKDQLDIVRYHHEATDGSGYPEGLFGGAIPRYARLAHVVDVFDALISERAYKSALSQPDALKLMTHEMRPSFDPEFVNAFAHFLEGPASLRPLYEETININIGANLFLQLEQEDTKIKSTLVGIEEGEYLIVRATSWVQENFKRGLQVIVRYILNGQANGFVGTVIGVITRPYPLLFLTYPKMVEQLNLRSEERTASLFPIKIIIRDKLCRCLIVDISTRGCKIRVKNYEREKLPLVLKDENMRIIGRLHTDKEQELNGTIRRIEIKQDTTLLGVQFKELSDDMSMLLRSYLDEMRPLMC